VATYADPATRAWAVLIEDLRGATLLDAVDDPDAWRREHVDAAVDGIAAIHGAWHGRVNELRRQHWIGPVRTTTSAHAMTPLWRALADHAAPMFAAWTDASVPRRQQALIDRLGDWRPALDAAPHTLIHNDFNPRNVCLRRADDEWRLCAFDWELATIGAPVRDLAEFLCFVAPAGVPPARLSELVERHAAGFSAAAGVPVDRAAWDLAFRAALAELLLDRLSVYAMVHRVRPQQFLPRVLRTWSMLHSLFPVHGLAG
jgi:aminoglycoside phosphotransferase (APT) family kinase protein